MRPEAWALAGLYTLYRGAARRARAGDVRGADRARPGAVGARRLGGHRRPAALAARDRGPGRDRRPPPRPLTGPYWAAKYLGSRCASRWRSASRSGSRSPGATRARALVAPLRGAVACRVSPLFGLPRLRPHPESCGLLRRRGVRLAAAPAGARSGSGWPCSPRWSTCRGTRSSSRPGEPPRLGRLLPRPARGRGVVRVRARSRLQGSAPPTTARSRTCAGGSRATRARSRPWRSSRRRAAAAAPRDGADARFCSQFARAAPRASAALPQRSWRGSAGVRG